MNATYRAYLIFLGFTIFIICEGYNLCSFLLQCFFFSLQLLLLSSPNIHFSIMSWNKSCGRAVGVATGYGLDDQRVGVRDQVRSRIFTFPYLPNWFCGLPCLLSNGYTEALPLGVKQPGYEADHSSPTSAKVKKS
jgi:hypothetical protein